jgi:hypothetical protein
MDGRCSRDAFDEILAFGPFALEVISTTQTLAAIRIYSSDLASVVFAEGRCYRRLGTHLALVGRMTTKSLTDRVAALDAKVGNKSIESQFREQAELIDRRFSDSFREQAELIDRVFTYRFEELDKRLAPRFATMERAIGAVQSNISTLQSDVSTLRSDVGTLRKDVNSLQKDMVVVRDGIRVLLTRRPR